MKTEFQGGYEDLKEVVVEMPDDAWWWYQSGRIYGYGTPMII